MSITAERIQVELTLDDGSYVVSIKNAASLARVFGRDIQTMGASVQRTEKRIRGMTASLRDWSLIIGQSRNVLHQFSYLTTRWMGAIVRTNAEIERMTYLLKGMSTAGTEVERLQDATDTVDLLFETAKNAPFAINALTDTFVKFKSVGLDPTDGSMNSLVDAVAAFGGSDEVLHRASIAIQQMAGKGVISMEELRQQLGEAVPQAITIMARELGVTYGQLVDQISKGNVAAEQALQAMFIGFDASFGGRAAKLMESFNGQVAKLRTNLIELFSKNEGMNNFFEAVKNGIRDLNGLLESGAFDSWISGLGNALVVMVDFVRGITDDVIVLIDNIVNLTQMVWGGIAFVGDNVFAIISATAGASIPVVSALAQALLDVHHNLTTIHGFLGENGGLFKVDENNGFQKFLKETFGFNMADILEPVNDLTKNLDQTLLQERMIDGGFLKTSEIEKANQLYQSQLTTLESLRVKQDQVGESLFQNNEAQQEMIEMRRRAAESGNEGNFEFWQARLAAARLEAEGLQAEFEAVGASIADAEDNLFAMDDTLTDVTKRTAKEISETFKDAYDVGPEIEEAARKRSERLIEIAESESMSIQEKIDARKETNTEFYNHAIAQYESMLEAARTAIGSETEAAGVAFDLVATFIENRIAQFRANLATTLTIADLGGPPTVTTKKPKGGGGGKSPLEKMKEMQEDLQREADKTAQKMKDPFAFEIPSSMEKTREKIRELAKELGGMTPALQALMDMSDRVEVDKIMLDIAEATREITRGLMGEDRQRQENYNDEVRRLKNMKAALIEQGIWRVEHERMLQEQLIALRDQMESQSPLGKFFNEWKNLFEDMEQLAADTFRDVSQELADMVTEGEADFASLARAALNSFLQIQFNAAISGIGDLLSKAVGGLFSAGVSHAGSIIGEGGGRQRQIALPKFHTGGIVGANEQLAVLEKKEGVFTQGQMQALGGLARKSPDVTVNMINNSSQPVETEQTGVRFDGERMILDVVLKNLNRPGTFRDGIRGATK